MQDFQIHGQREGHFPPESEHRMAGIFNRYADREQIS